MIVPPAFKKYLKRSWFYLLFPLSFAVVALLLLVHNGAFIFEYTFLNTYGDQHHYYNLAYELIKGRAVMDYYTLGYSLLYLPFILLTGVSQNWESIMSLLIPFQAFVMVPATIYIIFKDKTKRDALAALAILAAYYLVFLLRSGDILIKYNFFGLMPLSEPLAIACLIGAHYAYLKYVKAKAVAPGYIALLVALIAGGLLTRNTSAILFAPIFIDLLLDRRFLRLFVIGALTGLVYLPQLIYNHICCGDILYNGYVWKSVARAERNANIVEALYGVRTNALFSIRYLVVNLKVLLLQYIPLLVLATINLMRKNRLVILIVLFSVINLIFHLSYWWSQASGLLDRFLLPNILLLLFIYKNQLIQGGHRVKS